MAETEAQQLFWRLARASFLLESLQQECLEPLGLTFVEYTVLRVLTDGPKSPSRLAEYVVRTTGGMTKIVDRLQRRDLVRRVPDPDDRPSEPRRFRDRPVSFVRRSGRMSDAQERAWRELAPHFVLSVERDAAATSAESAIVTLLGSAIAALLPNMPRLSMRAVVTPLVASASASSR